MYTKPKNALGMALWLYPVLSYISLKFGLELISPLRFKKEERRRENIKIRYMMVRGLARPCQASGFCGCARHGQARPCHCRHGPCQASGILGSNFFLFSWILLEQLPTKQLKTKENKQKAIKCVGCLPRSARLKSLAWQLEGGFSTLYSIFHKETRASNWHSLPNHMWLS